MILQQFPDLQWLKQQTERRFASRKAWGGQSLEQPGWPNVILNVNTTGTYRDNIRGPLSIFTNLAGESHVEAAKRRTTIKEGFFFLTNHDQHYTLDINTSKPTETFNIHFGEHFADPILQAYTQSPDTLLDNQVERPAERIEFHNRIHYRSQAMNDTILFLRDQKPNGILLEEKLSDLISTLLHEEKRLKQNSAELPVLKSTTRAEIMKRLLLASDYVYSYFDKDLSLDELAAVSCLSKFHFLRLFKIAFHKTPHQFINEVRIQRSKELLTRTQLDVKNISRAVGFDTSSSFSRMFFQQTGLYPTQYRE